MGIEKALSDNEKNTVKIHFLSEEAYKTSEIEGELLDRASLQSSIQKHLGLTTQHPQGRHPREYGVAEMMVDLYHNYDKTLDESTLFNWHSMLMNGRRDLDIIGGYRTHAEPMQIISGRPGKITIHFEAVPSANVTIEMAHFIKWFKKHLCHPSLRRVLRIFILSLSTLLKMVMAALAEP